MSLRPFALERFFARYEFNVPYLLCASDCESMTIGELLSLEQNGAEALHDLTLGYTESAGSPRLRAAVCALYSSIAPEQVLVHGGAEEAIFVFMHALCRRGDEVIVQQPCYQSLGEVARSLGCAVVPWRMRPEPRWSLDPDELTRLVTPATRAIVINTPHNPTGYQMPREMLQATVACAESHGIVLFSDEVYRGLESQETDRLPAACDLSPRAVSLGVMSKTYGLPGLRIGWAASRNSTLLARMAEIKDYTSICAAGPSEVLAEIALRHAAQLALRSRHIIAANLEVLDAFFGANAESFLWHRPDAGPIAFPRFLKGSVDRLCDVLAREAGVLLLPGTVYGDSTERFRIGFGRKTLPVAVERLAAYLASRGAGPRP